MPPTFANKPDFFWPRWELRSIKPGDISFVQWHTKHTWKSQVATYHIDVNTQAICNRPHYHSLAQRAAPRHGQVKRHQLLVLRLAPRERLILEAELGNIAINKCINIYNTKNLVLPLNGPLMTSHPPSAPWTYQELACACYGHDIPRPLFLSYSYYCQM